MVHLFCASAHQSCQLTPVTMLGGPGFVCHSPLLCFGTQEPDGGLLNPDMFDSSYSPDTARVLPPRNTSTDKQSKKPPSSHPHLHNTRKNSSQPFSSISPSLIPQDLNASKKRATFRSNRGNSLFDETISHDTYRPGSNRFHPTRHAPSFDTSQFIAEEEELSSLQFQDSGKKMNRSSQSPMPIYNPDMVLPTINFIKNDSLVPKRKPLVKQSSTTFLDELRTSLQPRVSKSSAFRTLVKGKSAPVSPEFSDENESSSKNVLPVVSRAGRSYSQEDLRVGSPKVVVGPPAVAGRTPSSTASDDDGGSGSCVANLGELSEAASLGDAEMPCNSNSNSWDVIAGENPSANETLIIGAAPRHIPAKSEPLLTYGENSKVEEDPHSGSSSSSDRLQSIPSSGLLSRSSKRPSDDEGAVSPKGPVGKEDGQDLGARSYEAQDNRCVCVFVW